PTVHVEFPNGGEVLDGDRIPVSWSASDPDGDPLAFCVQYSPDGQTWETVALDVRETSIELDAVNVSAGNQARVRVLATDGINSAVDDSDAPFRVPNRDPQVFLSEPAGDTVIVSGRSLTLAGGAYDPDEGTLPGEQLEWSSSIDGTLGAGSALVVADLSLGVHDITLRAVDGQGGGATASVSVTVVATPQDLDQEPDGLVVRPDRIVFDPDRGETAERLEIGNRRPGRRIAWRATSSVPWISLDPSTGLAPATVLVRLEEGGLAPGSNTGSVRFTSRDVPGQTVTVPVEVEVRSVTRFRRAEANGDGIVDLTDAIFTLGCLFLGTECPSCPDAADSNDSGAVDLSDAVYTLGFLFVGGPAPKPPFPACGEDRTLDSLEECSDPSCP
ncbi:MAG: hypothetical protein O7J95_11590, partial [Planctomycetota bacterium]|nr:hypothetical protein [Planctomycetota bacterium]